MSTEQLIALSLIIDKMQIKDEIVNLDGKTNEEVGKQLIALFICNLHKAADDIYSFIANYKKITVEDAKKANIIEILKEILNTAGVKDFLA